MYAICAAHIHTITKKQHNTFDQILKTNKQCSNLTIKKKFKILSGK